MSIDWRSLLERRTDGFSTAVGGARVGDGFDALPFDSITQLRPDTPSVDRSWGSEGVFDLREDGSQVAVPRETLLAELRQYGGRAYAGMVTFELADGRIRSIWVRGLLLRTLPIGSEAAIEQWLGPSSGVERTLGWNIHHYPERGLSVGWHAKEGRLEHVAFGPVGWTEPKFGAREVLSEWLAAHSVLAPEWKEPEDRASSKWVRHARVMALLRAFELGSPEDFSQGRFLEEKALSGYPRAAGALKEFERDFPKPRSDSLCRLFWWLLTYREEAEPLLQIHSGWLSASHPGILTALRATGRANSRVKEALSEVETLLVELISPSGKQVTEREMIERWGWPQVDLQQLLQDELW